MNRIILIGRLTKDPEYSVTGSGIGVCRFTLAVDRKFKNADGEKETDFFNVTAWRGLAENCNKYLVKGNMTAVGGEVNIRKYEAKDGSMRTSVDVIADDVQFLTPKSEGGENRNPRKARSIDEMEEVEDTDDLPF